MPAKEFDSYAQEYRDIINRTSHISGEEYEFFVRFRILRMKRKLSLSAENAGALRILDLGCGIGASAEILEEEFPEATIIGVDSSQESVTIALRRELPRAKFLCCAAESMPLNEASVDLVYCNGLIHHTSLERRPALLQELFRVVRPKGQIFLFENNPANPLMMWAMTKYPFDKEAKPVAARKLRNLVKSSGFLPQETVYYFFFPHCLRFLRWTEYGLERLPFGAQYFIWATRPDKL